MAQDIWKLFEEVVPIGSGSFVIILINTVLSFIFSQITFFPVNGKNIIQHLNIFLFRDRTRGGLRGL